jgi:hypothetical protein
MSVTNFHSSLQRYASHSCHYGGVSNHGSSIKLIPRSRNLSGRKSCLSRVGAIVVVYIQVCICHDQQWRWLTSVFLWTSPPTKVVGLQKLGHFTLCDEAIFPNSCSLKGNHHYKPCLIRSKFIKTKIKFQKKHNESKLYKHVFYQIYVIHLYVKK